MLSNISDMLEKDDNDDKHKSIVESENDFLKDIFEDKEKENQHPNIVVQNDMKKRR